MTRLSGIMRAYDTFASQTFEPYEPPPMDVQTANRSSTAQVAAPAAGAWSFDAAAAEAPLREPVRAELADLGIIAVTGEDAAHFLHGQLTSDIEHLATDRHTLAGYCTAKGRLLATFHVWRDERAIYLLLPRELLAGVLKRLSMFVLRARVRLSDESQAWRACAVFGAGAEARVRSLGGEVPASSGQCITVAGVRVARLRGSTRLPERFLLLVPVSESRNVESRLSRVQTVDDGAFWWSEIDAGIPTVFAATQEKFVPQMINFEVIGGVSFSKGCYPGQEVVARSQYRGRVKRRMQLAHCTAYAPAGADVFAVGEVEPAGTVVMSATAPKGGFDLLFEISLDKAELTLRLASPDGEALQQRALPYDLVDVTA